ncbi:hypothetical protein [Parasulfitobacter algicola]|uniref:Sulfotransferase family protein n=1 Tax=Parasulfitobacter algicola TaxID=2614809 RepID=A0ABX2IX62_9RHOB|nr:hypothetical protein [Sulfitobacter algicola]NSX55780.1 hypothetical protein [Sulfitobacter algicola]
MQIAYHIGVHCTDEDKLLRSVFKNKGFLIPQGIIAPRVKLYRRQLREAIEALKGARVGPDVRRMLLQKILGDQPEPKRLILSNPNFIAGIPGVFQNGKLYPRLEHQVQSFINIFAHDELEIFIGIRNPATFIPAVMKHMPDKDIQTVLSGFNPQSLRWSNLCARITEIAPQADLTVWCNEDTPLIWSRIIRAYADMEPDATVEGAFDLLPEIMSHEGLDAFYAQLEQEKPANDADLLDLKIKYLERHAMDGAMEEELDVPGWSAAYVEKLTQLYDMDVARIAGMPGIRFIQP